MPDLRPTNREQFIELAQSLRSREGYVEPVAFGIGMATRSLADDSVLDSWYPVVNLGENLGAAAIVADVVGHSDGSATYELTAEILAEVLHRCAPMVDDGGDHPNLRVLSDLAWATPAAPQLPVRRTPIITFIGDLDEAPVDAHDVYLRLHLLSYRLVAPHGLNLDGQFGLLSNVVWTTLGPCDVASFEAARSRLRSAGTSIAVTSVDKFPRMLDYVVPSGVRIADGERVRLGAHLAEGTTVMHEGFVNFNAGTLGSAMVEGRISAGVVLGASTDLGGGASIMGTLSGGGKEVISVGEQCLIGANAGLGISLGDRCIIEAGLYVTAGTIVTLPDGSTAKARELSGSADLLFRRNSTTGTVEVLPRSGAWEEGLNAALHAN